MNNINYPWLEKAWSELQAQRARLPHALLVHGAPDIGKRELATHFAQSLLCDTPAPHGHPCGVCQACRWFSDGNHPDFRAILPESLQPGDAAEPEEGADKTSKTKTPSREIKIDQIRALDGFFNIGTHRGGARVVLVYPAEALNVPSSNALLKTLEEPAPNTVFLLVTSHPDQLLPTIRSRAAKFGVGAPAAEACIGWLAGQGIRNAADRLAESGGAPLAALRSGEAQEHDAQRTELLDALASGRFDPLVIAERCEKAGNENLVLWLMRWVSDLLRACQLGAAPSYHPALADSLRRLAALADVTALHRYYRKLTEARRVAGHPLNARLFAEELLIDYGRLIQDKR